MLTVDNTWIEVTGGHPIYSVKLKTHGDPPTLVYLQMTKSNLYLPDFPTRNLSIVDAKTAVKLCLALLDQLGYDVEETPT